jgi:hypothetical protein
MAASVSELFSEAVGLEARDRATLAGLLLESLGPAQRGAANAACAQSEGVHIIGWEEFWSSCCGAQVR